MFWFIINLASLYDKEYTDVVKFFSEQPSKTLFCLFIVFSFFFSALTISEIFEDYINNEKTKNVANKALNFFAIVIPLITIISLFIIKL